ncbi:MAG: hypothetical protein J6S85_06445 [Methanobrevibacter sp.]|nr:hypothetical protein [Methanobrevibacter sp.]
MSKGLEALKDLREVKGWNNDEFERRLDIIEKSLKALEIIKEKQVYIRALLAYKNNLAFYNEDMSESRKLTKEEFNLLKEVLL